MPDNAAGQYLVDAMMRMGPSRAAMEGERAADWPEIDAFSRCTGALLDGWEMETVWRMAQEYTMERRNGKDPLCIPPVER